MSNKQENFLEKAFYLGVGMASYAVEKVSASLGEVNQNLQELRQKATQFFQEADFPQKLQQLADDMVAKGKITTEEARRFVQQILSENLHQSSPHAPQSSSEPRIIDIEILDEEEE
ncbi:MAG: hypothetical protein NZ901_05235 [Geminocystis sp.]|nr:hypothetical protein [Geminocystis sp.]HIK36484.1 hypothetical protein [Geminocystis sp. M7585_C2015_104]MCS7147578.1 hypothetical protein [Geminocystis sp.]MCX8077981.1 hypothetical protein [Geminocystis sp.]MDW8115271.1 hypothetical protein [Geminocystis sp.]